jgi:hypothetical protein
MMDHEIEAFIRNLLRRHNLLTLATWCSTRYPSRARKDSRVNCLARASSDGEGLKSLSPDRDQLPNHRTEDLQK